MPIKYLVAVVVRLVLMVVIFKSALSLVPTFIIMPSSAVVMLFIVVFLVVCGCMLLWFRYDVFMPKSDEILDKEINVDIVGLLKVAIIGISFYFLFSTTFALLYLIMIYQGQSVETYNYFDGNKYLIIYYLVQIIMAVFCIIKANWLTHLLLGKVKSNQ